MFADLGVSTAQLKARAGHASSDAAERYQHATQQRSRELAEELNGRIRRPRRDLGAMDAGSEPPARSSFGR